MLLTIFMKLLLYRKHSARHNECAISKRCRMPHRHTTVIGRSRPRKVSKKEQMTVHI